MEENHEKLCNTLYSRKVDITREDEVGEVHHAGNEGCSLMEALDAPITSDVYGRRRDDITRLLFTEANRSDVKVPKEHVCGLPRC